MSRYLPPLRRLALAAALFLVGCSSPERSAPAANAPPVARFSLSPDAGEPPLTVTFDASASRDADGSVVGYAWAFGDGAVGEGATAEHVYVEPGTFTATLTVEDDGGARDSAEATVRVGAALPTAAFTATPAETPLTLRFDASASRSPNGAVRRYVWAFGDGEAGAGVTVEHTYPEPGRYRVELSVTDGAGQSSSAAQEVTLEPPEAPDTPTAPVARFTMTPPGGLAPLIVTFDAGASSDADGDIRSYAWDFGDGETGEGAQVSHRYGGVGSFDVTLTVTDAAGLSDSASQAVEVSGLEPLAADGHGFRRGGEPFLWLADTAWLLFVGTTREQAAFYLDDAVAKGFTVIQAALTAYWPITQEGGFPPAANRAGELPFLENDPTRLNPAYFDEVAWVAAEAAKRGLYLAITYGEPLRTEDKLPFAVADAAQAYAYGRAVGARLRDETRQNVIVWVSGQDRNPDKGLGEDAWLAAAEGLTDGVTGSRTFDGAPDYDADYDATFMSHHPDGGGVSYSSSQWFHEAAFLDFNIVNVWKYYARLVGLVQGDYARTPAKPTVCFEPSYEAQEYDDELRTAWHARFQGYWCLLSGAAGYAYGHGGGANDPPDAGYNVGLSTAWPGYLESEGRNDMRYLRALFEPRLAELVPDQALVVAGQGSTTGKSYLAAARAQDGSFALVYAPRGAPFTLDLGRLGAGPWTARWFDPRTGEFGPGERVAGASKSFDPPEGGAEGNDWVLVLDAP